MTPDLLTKLEAPDVRAETYLRAWLHDHALRVVRGTCSCGRPGCEHGRALRLAGWLERRAYCCGGRAVQA